jgi:ApeA N-terminal domain 1
LHLRFAKRAGLRTIFKRVSEIRNFLSLAVGRPVSVLSVIGYQDDYARGQTTFPRPIEIYWQIPNNPEPPTKSRHFTEMLFTLEEARPEMSTVMKRWFQKQARLEPVFNLFFGTLYHPSLYLEVKFLAYAQAIRDLRLPASAPARAKNSRRADAGRARPVPNGVEANRGSTAERP